MRNKPLEIGCRKISGGIGHGEILSSPDDICFYLTEPETGILRDPGHSLDGQSLSNKVLIFPSGKGSAVVQDEGLFSLQKHGNLPHAFIIQTPETVLVFGALLLKIPLVDSVDPTLYQHLRNGLTAEVDADRGLITVQSSITPANIDCE